MSGYATHEVLNQPPEFAGFNAYLGDVALCDAVAAFGATWAQERLAACGARIGSAHMQVLARDANRHTPELRTHDRFGHRIDEVEFHPAWHELMTMLRADEVHALGWNAGRPGAQTVRAALSYLWSQGEAGVGCPAAMTFASIAAFATRRRCWKNSGRRSCRPATTPRPRHRAPKPRSPWQWR